LRCAWEWDSPWEWESHGIPRGNGNEKQISMRIRMGMISMGVGMLENALRKKIPIDIKFKAK